MGEKNKDGVERAQRDGAKKMEQSVKGGAPGMSKKQSETMKQKL